MMDYFEEKISKMSVTEMESFRKKDLLYRLLFSVVLILIGLFGIYQKNSYLLGLFWLLVLSFLIGYTVYYIIFLRGVTKILTTQLEPATAKAIFEKVYPKKNPLGRLNCAIAEYLMGNFSTAQAYVSVLLSKKHLSKPVVQDCRYLQCLLFIVQHQVLETEAQDFLSQYLGTVDGRDTAKKQTIKAMIAIENGTPNPYFETAEMRHNLEKVMYQFYQAKNELLVGNHETAKAIFRTVSELNEELFYVREAQKYLKEL